MVCSMSVVLRLSVSISLVLGSEECQDQVAMKALMLYISIKQNMLCMCKKSPRMDPIAFRVDIVKWTWDTLRSIQGQCEHTGGISRAWTLRLRLR